MHLCCVQVNGNYDLYSMDMQEFNPRKFVLGYSAVTDCTDYYTDAKIRPLNDLGNVPNGICYRE